MIDRKKQSIKTAIMATIFVAVGVLGFSTFGLQGVIEAAHPAQDMRAGMNKIDGNRGGSLEDGVATIINMMLYVLGAVAVVMIVYGGIMYTTSNGNPENIKKAKTILIYAVVGLVVALLAYAIVNFVIGAFEPPPSTSATS